MYLLMDMGTSNTRLWLCDGDRIIGSAKGAFGAGSTKKLGREYLVESLKALMGALLSEHSAAESEVECVMASGMAGSNIGLCDIPHIPLPANAAVLAKNLRRVSLPEVTEIPFVFVPGLKKLGENGIEDVMRGEETETAGIIAACADCADAVLVLPGTHNKVIATDKDGMINDFFTGFSGELLNIIMEHSILSGQVFHGLEIVDGKVLEGAKYADENGLNAAIFHVRVMGMNQSTPEEMTSFLYGAVMSQDVSAIRRMAQGRRVFVGGRESLRRVYTLLLGEGTLSLDEAVAEGAVMRGLLAFAHIGRD